MNGHTGSKKKKKKKEKEKTIIQKQAYAKENSPNSHLQGHTKELVCLR